MQTEIDHLKQRLRAANEESGRTREWGDEARKELEDCQTQFGRLLSEKARLQGYIDRVRESEGSLDIATTLDDLQGKEGLRYPDDISLDAKGRRMDNYR